MDFKFTSGLPFVMHPASAAFEKELKEFSAEESMRLFYVAVTRAKKKLYITAPLKVKSFGKESEQSPSIIFNDLF